MNMFQIKQWITKKKVVNYSNSSIFSSYISKIV